MYENIEGLIGEGKAFLERVVEWLDGKVLDWIVGGFLWFLIEKGFRWASDRLGCLWQAVRRRDRDKRAWRTVTLSVPNDGPNGFSLPGGIGPGSKFKVVPVAYKERVEKAIIRQGEAQEALFRQWVRNTQRENES